jgi:hypothetical protein
MANVQLSALGATIKTAYEGQPDTNGFTNAEKTKVANSITALSEDSSPSLGGNLNGANYVVSNTRMALNVQTGTSYTLLLADSGKIITLDNGSAITVDLPEDLPEGWNCTVIQKGAGQITFSVAGSAILLNSSTHSKTSAQYAEVSLKVIQNTGGTTATYVLSGDTGT